MSLPCHVFSLSHSLTCVWSRDSNLFNQICIRMRNVLHSTPSMYTTLVDVLMMKWSLFNIRLSHTSPTFFCISYFWLSCCDISVDGYFNFSIIGLCKEFICIVVMMMKPKKCEMCKGRKIWKAPKSIWKFYFLIWIFANLKNF